jgi:hypothetical protein
MDITLKMKIQDQEIELKANLTNAAGRIYRQQFSRDLLKDMSDIYKKLHKSLLDGIDMTGINITGKTEQEIYEQLMAHVDVSKLLAIRAEQEQLSFEETEKGEQIIWAFVKNADKNTPNFSEWSESFDYVLPVGDIVTALFEAWGKSAQPTVELKN